jgi:tripartite-type tricarboxylate transporter receptor subunit TctC
MKQLADKILAALAATCALVGASMQALSQPTADFPAKSIQLVIVYAPGGGLDVVGRIVADRLTRNLGRTVVVENRPGAGGNIGTASLVKAAPDGYTLLETTNSYNINAFIYKNPGYDARKDFAPVVQLTEAPSVITTGPRSPYRSLTDLVSAARADPGKIAYGSAGNGSPTHIAAEMFKTAANIDLAHIPYKSAAQRDTDVMGGQLPLGMSALPAVMAQIKSGTMRAIAVTSEKRWPTLPDVPSLAESGYPKLTHMTWIGILVPAATPQPIIVRLNREIVAALANPEVRERIIATGAEPVGNSPAEFEAMLRAEYDATGKVVSQIGLKVD